MTRRVFLSTLAASTALRAVPRPRARITRIALASIQGRFHKFVAMNSYDRAPKGHTYTNTLIRMATDEGPEGIGVMVYASPEAAYLKALKQLIGVDPFSLFTLQDGQIADRAPAHAPLLSAYPHLDGPLLDLIGKLTGNPVWRLLGEAVRDRVEAYDGTLYFSDIWFRDRGVRAVLEEAEEAVKSGYLGLKLKVGRGWKWMPHEAGLARDIEVLQATRRAVGPEIKLMADANDGFRNDFEGAWRLMHETKDVNLYWMEEIFPEDIQAYTRLRERMAAAGIKTLIADGENLREPEDFKRYLNSPRTFDVVQMDIRVGGFLANRELARLAEAAGATSVPHNWASQVGKFMGLHLAKAIKGVTAVEDDRSTCDVILAEGYEFKGGYYSVSNAPGLGIKIDEEVYREKYRTSEIVVS
jgi:L-alanine-DL-glutamate epimerase-like enolase superfamily enzyme